MMCASNSPSPGTLASRRREKMPASHMMKLVSACCAGFLMSMPVTLVEGHKGFYDYRGDADRANPLGCGE